MMLSICLSVRMSVCHVCHVVAAIKGVPYVSSDWKTPSPVKFMVAAGAYRLGPIQYMSILGHRMVQFLHIVFSTVEVNVRYITAVPAEGNGDLQTLICVLVARPRQCSTLSNPVPRQNWMVAYLGYTLWMKTLFRGWPVIVHNTNTRRRSDCFTMTIWGYHRLIDS